jgi:hypothetical protein
MTFHEKEQCRFSELADGFRARAKDLRDVQKMFLEEFQSFAQEVKQFESEIDVFNRDYEAFDRQVRKLHFGQLSAAEGHKRVEDYCLNRKTENKELKRRFKELIRVGINDTDRIWTEEESQQHHGNWKTYNDDMEIFNRKVKRNCPY